MALHAKKALVVLSAILSLANATCYWPTGNATYERDLTEHQPCSNDTTSPLHTICCALNRTNPSGGDKIYGRTNDECLPNGVCRNRVLDRGTMQVSYWRETCTSDSWKNGDCLDVCADDWSSGNGTTGAVMTPCDGTEKSLKWCCGTSTDCCNDASKVKILAFEFKGAIPNTASATPRPAASSTSSATPSSSATGAAGAGNQNGNGGGSSGGLSTGAKAGIGVGASVGGLALIALGFLLARRSSKNSKNAAHDAHGANNPGYPHQGYAYERGDGQGQLPPPGVGYAAAGGPEQEKHTYRHEMEHRSRSELAYSPALSPEQRKPAPQYELSS